VVDEAFGVVVDVVVVDVVVVDVVVVGNALRRPVTSRGTVEITGD
jgi:hypothetical protein